jgi:PucR C-terminal helix-turn-helix domain
MAAGGTSFRELAEMVPAEAIDALRPSLGGLIDEIVRAIAEDSAIYDQVLGAPAGLGIRLAIEQSVQGFLHRVEHPDAAAGEIFGVWHRLGEAEFRTGRSLESLQAAWRVGGRAAWRGAARLFEEVGIEPHTLAALAEAIFAYIDELSSQVVDGFASAQSDEVGERERHRQKLARLLVHPEERDPAAIEREARLAHWRMPGGIAALALSGDGRDAIAAAMGADTLTGVDALGPWLLIPDPDGPGRAERLRRASQGTLAALGPSVPPRAGARSLRLARTALRLAQAGALESRGLVSVSENLLAVLLLQDSELAQMFARQRLGKLVDLPPARRQSLLETLSSWLAHQRHVPTIAAELHVHPQTVRYRLGQLRELLGDDLEKPEARFELEVALRVSELTQD